ncbi:2523_t:CDS:10 [Diversispora eburnea]|uniref:2523_t:CDS:1 n=1 Tax=Diversispora eburnea TaxID=1213867 RepID=A0A9N8VTJ1_9GLOM|nr:2523_t:CDS:10 [Diversispora eburnea]
MVSTNNSDIDVVKNFLHTPGSIEASELVTALGIMNISLDGANFEQKMQNILSAIPLTSIFMLLGSVNEAVTSVTCKVLNKLLRPMSYKDVNSSGLEIEKSLESEEAIQDLIKSPLFSKALECLGYEDIPTSTKMADFFTKLANTSDSGLQALFNSESVAILKRLSEGNETIKFRVFDLIARISTSSSEAFQLCISTGALDPITSELNSDDLLVRLNAVETFSKIIQSKSGYYFLERSGIIKSLVDYLTKDDDKDIVLVLIKSASLKFFGKLSEIEEVDFFEVENKYKILTQLDAHLLSDNLELKTTTINVIGMIGHNPLGLKLLYNCTSPNILSHFMDLYHSSVGEEKLICMQTISCLIGASDSSTGDIDNITEQIYQQIGGYPTPLKTLMANAKVTIEDIRIANFAIMQEIASHPWGKIEMSRSKEFIDYILNRTTESTHKGKEWKYSIVQTLNSNSDTIIAPNVLQRLRKYLSEGPFYVRTTTTVALESG